MEQNGLARLSLALHYSVPPILGMMVAFIFVVDKTFELFRLLSNRLNKRVLACFLVFYNASKVALTSISAYELAVRCNLHGVGLAAPLFLDLYGGSNTCLPALSAVSIASLCILWVDRIAVPFLDLSGVGQTGFQSRAVKAAVTGSVFMALAENDPFVLALLAMLACLRPKSLRTNWLPYAGFLTRGVVAALAVARFAGYGSARVSKRSVAIAMCSALASK